MKIGFRQVSSDKIHFNQKGLFFFSGDVHVIAFSHCGKLLAVGSQDVHRRFSYSEIFRKRY